MSVAGHVYMRWHVSMGLHVCPHECYETCHAADARVTVGFDVREGYTYVPVTLGGLLELLLCYSLNTSVQH